MYLPSLSLAVLVSLILITPSYSLPLATRQDVFAHNSSWSHLIPRSPTQWLWGEPSEYLQISWDPGLAYVGKKIHIPGKKDAGYFYELINLPGGTPAFAKMLHRGGPMVNEHAFVMHEHQLFGTGYGQDPYLRYWLVIKDAPPIGEGLFDLKNMLQRDKRQSKDRCKAALDRAARLTKEKVRQWYTTVGILHTKLYPSNLFFDTQLTKVTLAGWSNVRDKNM